MAATGPPEALVQSLVDGPSIVSGVEWHGQIDSTNARCAALAADGAPEGTLVLADVQTAGRGRRGRGWQAPPGTSLMGSYLLRPTVDAGWLPLVPLLMGVCLADAVEPHIPGAQVALKWPNDLLVRGSGGQPWRKAAGILVETAHASSLAVVAGVGVNVDWRGQTRPDELAGAGSLAEARGGDVDRWRLLAAFAGVLTNRYAAWQAEPPAVLDDYRPRCATLGRTVRVDRGAAGTIDGLATGIDDHGALQLDAGDGVMRVTAGDVTHLRHA